MPGYFSQALAAMVVVALVAGMALVGALAPIDDALRALRFEATSRVASGETIFVEIDAQSLARLGVWPWPRTLHAEIVDRLMDAGAAEVVMDIDFSTASTEESDLALEKALERAGGYVRLAAFQQTDANGTTVLNRPLPRFARYSDAVLVNVDGDGTGLLQSLPMGLASPAIPSVATALSPEVIPAGESLTIDYGIDLRTIERVPVADLLDGKVDPARFADKQVIVGASAIELRDFFRVPRFGVISGAMVQLAAVETLKARRALIDLGIWPSLLLLVVAAAAFAATQHRLRLWLAVLISSGAMAGIEIGAWLLQRQSALLIDTTPLHWGIVLLVLTKLVLERAIRWREFMRQQTRLAYLARHDVVSGALTQQALLDDLEPRLEAGEPTSAIVLHLGRFDDTIASLGHDVGDRVAAEVVTRLEHELQRTPARIGLDQFAWSVDDGLSVDQHLALCARLATGLDAPYLIGGHRVVLDSRFGCACVMPDTPISAGELLRQADAALFHARETRVKAAVFDAAQGLRIAERRIRDIELRRALERGEFYLLYQPQYDLKTGALVGVEALARWRNEALGLVSPADFIPLAEETGLIVELGAWIVGEACRQAAKWQWDGRLAVNFSSEQFRRSDVVATVRDALTVSGFRPDRLDIEITESLLIGDDASVPEALEALRAMGIGIALDDFGTGYSSLSYLPRLPIDKLKIDQSFVRSLPDPGFEALVETIVLMAKRLDKRLVAEGIETVQQRDYLAQLGCEIGQGFLFAPPSTPEALGLSRRIDAA